MVIKISDPSLVLVLFSILTPTSCNVYPLERIAPPFSIALECLIVEFSILTLVTENIKMNFYSLHKSKENAPPP